MVSTIIFVLCGAGLVLAVLGLIRPVGRFGGRRGAGAIAGVCVFGLVMWTHGAFDPVPALTDEEIAALLVDHECGDDRQAWIMAKKLVSAQLVAPTEAEFPSMRRSEVERLECKRYLVTSYVDARNGYGAVARTPFIAELRYLGDDRWRLTNLTMSQVSGG